MALTMNQLVVGMFGAPAGNLLAGLEFAYGDDIASAAADFAANDLFPYDSVSAMVDALLAGTDVDAVESGARAWAESQTDVAAAAAVAIEFLLTTEDEAFASAKAQFTNKVAVAEYYSTGAAMVTFSDLATSQALLASVTADEASVTAITEAPVVVEGSTFTLTTGNDSIFGTSGNDSITGTDLTYGDADLIADSSTTDSDTLTINSSTDITATPTIVGIENAVFNATGANAGGDTSFDVDIQNVSASNVTVAATKSGTLIDTAALTNVKSGVTVSSGLATVTVATAANADVTVDGTRAAGTTVTQTGTADTLTVNTAGNFTTTGTTAEEAVTIVSGGTVSLTDAAANAAGTDVALTITAAGTVILDELGDTGDVTVTTSTGNIFVGEDGAGNAATDTDTDGTISLTTANGDVTVTDGDEATTLIISATGDADSTVAGADGDVTVTAADAATSATITATDVITITEMNAATSATLTAGGASTLNSVDALADLVLASNDTGSTAVTFTIATGEGQAIETVTATGDNDVTFAMGGDDIVAAETATGDWLVATDNSSATSRLDVNAASGAAIDLSDVAFDEIEFSADQAADAVTVANNAHIVISADQTNFSIETEASPNQNVTVELNHDTADTGITLSDLTTTNVNELTLNLTDEDATYELSDISLGTTKLVVTGDADALDVTTYTSFASFDASAISADVTVSDVVTAKQITTGSGADSFTVNDGNTTTVKIDGGSGVDTVVFTANDDFSAGDITFDNIDKLDVSASGVVLAASDVTGSDYIVFGNLLADSLELELNNATGETVDISDMSAALATVTVTGNTGADTITGMLTFATTINAGAGNDTITGGNLVDTIDGEGGNDTIVAGNGADVITGGTGADTIDLSEGTSAVDTVMLDQGDGSAVGAAAGTFSGYDVITGFTLAKDLIDTETGVAAATEVWASTAATTASNDLAASEFTDVDAIVAFINDITANETSVMDTNAITTLAITFDDFTAIYTVDNDATAAVAAAEVELLATVDAIVTATEMT